VASGSPCGWASDCSSIKGIERPPDMCTIILLIS
jgi:hypothetical protein